MYDLTLCIYDELVVEGSKEYEMLESVLNGGKVIKLFGIEYAVTNIEVKKHSPIEKYSWNAMDKTIINASRLIPIKMGINVKFKGG